MPEIKTVAELLDRVGTVVTFPDPLGELRARGFTLAPDVQAKLDAAGSSARLDPAKRQRLATLAGRLGRVRSTATGARQPILKALAASQDYDLVVALRLAVVNETLAALSEGMRYPRELTDAHGIGFIFTRKGLDALSADIPPDVSIGPLRLTAPASVSAIDGTDHLLFAQSFSLDFRRTLQFPSGASREITISSLNATARLGVAIRAEFGPAADELVLGLSMQFVPTDADKLVLNVAPGSPVQPRSATALRTFAADIQEPLRQVLNNALMHAVLSVCPVIHLPLSRSPEVKIRDIGVRAQSASDGDVIVAGVRFETKASPDDTTGDPETLVNPFPAGGPGALNTYARFTEAAFRKVVKELHRSGALEAKARETHGDLRVDGADVRLAPNEIKIILDMRVVNACGFGANTIDVNARVTVTFRFSVFEGQVFVTHSTDSDLDNTDVAICVIVEALQLEFFGALVSVIELILQLIRFAPLFGDDDDGGSFDIFPGIFDPRVPVPGTEVLPKAEAVQALVSEDRLEARGTLSLRPDDINTYIYAQFIRRSPQLLGGAPTPISRAAVQLVDQDFPRPAGDDAQPPVVGTTTTTAGPIVTTRTVTFEPPASDEVLGRDTTDDHGRVQFMLRPADLHNTAGKVVTTVLTENTKKEGAHTKTTRKALTEKLPDVYFRVTPPGGVTFDTRTFDHGFVLNLRSRRIGTAAAPLTFFTGRQGPLEHE